MMSSQAKRRDQVPTLHQMPRDDRLASKVHWTGPITRSKALRRSVRIQELAKKGQQKEDTAIPTKDSSRGPKPKQAKKQKPQSSRQKNTEQTQKSKKETPPEKKTEKSQIQRNITKSKRKPAAKPKKGRRTSKEVSPADLDTSSNLRRRPEKSRLIDRAGEETSKSQTKSISNWLEHVQDKPPEQLDHENPGSSSNYPEVNLPSNMSSRATTNAAATEPATDGTTKTGQSKVNVDKLWNRGIIDEPSERQDAWKVKLEEMLLATPPAFTSQSKQELRAAGEDMLRYIKQGKDVELRELAESFRLAWDRALAGTNQPIVLSKYFDQMIEKSSKDNEAVLQRTVMMNVFTPYWITENFDWNAEGQWQRSPHTKIPSLLHDTLSASKPDMTISFNYESFIKDIVGLFAIPSGLSNALCPEPAGFGRRKRCFPFLFMELKKATSSDLSEAYLLNLQHASQALYNMYLWMKRAGAEDEFFKDVRVFTFTFNATRLGVRIHRAIKITSKQLNFEFTEFGPEAYYSRDGVCNKVNVILNKYALTHLKPIMLDCFQKVIERPTDEPPDLRGSKRLQAEEQPSANTRNNANKRRTQTNREDGQRSLERSFDSDGLHTGSTQPLAQVNI